MAALLRIGDIDFDAATGEVFTSDGTVRLEPQPAAVLALLASRPRELVTHDELRKALWGDAVCVNFQQNLHYCIRQVRLALNQTGRESTIVESIPRRGYRLLATVEPRTSRGAHREPWVLSRTRRWPLFWAAVAAAALTGVAVVERRPNNHHQIAVELVQTVHDLVY